ncbi:MAG: hypothetical protein QG656_527 [Candidatus Hydrogenedentes bacterium]|nr:hypothetical protein [Candidatus Hydrogenedentota bacterium]
MRKRTINARMCGVLTLVFLFGACAGQADVQQVFDRIFGDAVKLDPAQHARVTSGAPGERHYVDANADGKPEEVWFIDTALRHPEKWRPLLVRVIDEDGDLEMGHEPDLDSDLYVADWKADGVVDAVCDYTDRDGDQDVDEMGLYFPGGPWHAAEDQVMVWWGEDVGDDNLLWYDIGYTYNQHACQYRSHFGGNELFCAYTIGLDDPEWTARFENPFVFYDRDDDGVTEEVIRIEGVNETVQNLRYSFDADDDATPDNPRDFDVSISAHAPQGLVFPSTQGDRRTLRGIPAAGFLSYDAVPEFSLNAPWSNVMLCWDENDLNIDGDGLAGNRFADTQERWEGVIAKGCEVFPQIGGPSCGALNKRYEAASKPQAPIRVYYAAADQRLHLFGADKSWMEVDFDYDRTVDMRYEYLDTDGDGYIDLWQLDLDLDGQPDDAWSTENAADAELAWKPIRGIATLALKAFPPMLFQLDARLREVTSQLGISDPDPVWRFLESGFDSPNLDKDVRKRLASSPESIRFYLELLRDRLIAAIKTAYAQPEFWNAFEASRAAGDWAGMRAMLEEEFQLGGPLPDFAKFQTVLLSTFAQPRVAWAQDWVPPNAGWESEVCGYRAYWGQFDFFGKTKPALVMSTFGEGVNYHEEQDWGMDALHVGATAGIGGVTLYVNSEPYPVRSPEGKGPIVWSKALDTSLENVLSVRLTAENVGPAEHPCTVRFLCTAMAGRRDSPITVQVEGGQPGDSLELGIGLTKLAQEDFAVDDTAGIAASWGVQQPAIGTIGMGIVYPRAAFLRHVDLPDEHQVVLKIALNQPLTYHIQGDWLRGRRFPCCPTIDNWLKELRATAALAETKR